MYVIKMCDDKSLRVTSNPRLFMGENRADDLLFLLPEQYGSIEIADCVVNMVAELGGSTLLTATLDRKEGVFANRYLMYGMSITNALTSHGGGVKIHLNILDEQNDVLMKTGEVTIRVEHSATESDPGINSEYVVPGGGVPGQVLVRTSTGVSWVNATDLPDLFMDRMCMCKVDEYLYSAFCRHIDYDEGLAYYAKYKPAIGACSAVAKGGLVGRNYDWTYDERVSFVIHTLAKNGRHETIGVASAPSAITQELADSGEYSEAYRVLPFLTLDGVNDAGVFCEINVAPTGDMGITTGTNPDGEDLFAAMIPRFVLDYASSVDEAVELLRERNIFCADSEAMKQEFHFLIADENKSVVVEFIQNEMVVIDTFVGDKPILTNLYLYGYDGTRESLTPYAMGIERQAILTEGYDAVDDAESMQALMNNVLYTKAYTRETDPFWYSEFCGDWTAAGWGDLTKDTPHEQYDPLVNKYIEIFENRERDGKTWQTVHESVYDLNSRELTVVPQESGNVHHFRLCVSGAVVYGE